MMKRRIVTALFSAAILSSNCYAGEHKWIHVAESKGGGSVYIDLYSMRRKGDGVTFLTLRDVTDVSSQSDYRSAEVFKGVYCSRNTVVILYGNYYSGNMASGKIIDKFDNYDVYEEAIIPGSMFEVEKKFVCKMTE